MIINQKKMSVWQKNIIESESEKLDKALTTNTEPEEDDDLAKGTHTEDIEKESNSTKIPQGSVTVQTFSEEVSKLGADLVDDLPSIELTTENEYKVSNDTEIEERGKDESQKNKDNSVKPENSFSIKASEENMTKSSSVGELVNDMHLKEVTTESKIDETADDNSSTAVDVSNNKKTDYQKEIDDLQNIETITMKDEKLLEASDEVENLLSAKASENDKHLVENVTVVTASEENTKDLDKDSMAKIDASQDFEASLKEVKSEKDEDSTALKVSEDDITEMASQVLDGESEKEEGNDMITPENSIIKEICSEETIYDSIEKEIESKEVEDAAIDESSQEKEIKSGKDPEPDFTTQLNEPKSEDDATSYVGLKKIEGGEEEEYSNEKTEDNFVKETTQVEVSPKTENTLEDVGSLITETALIESSINKLTDIMKDKDLETTNLESQEKETKLKLINDNEVNRDIENNSAESKQVIEIKSTKDLENESEPKKDDEDTKTEKVEDLGDLKYLNEKNTKSEKYSVDENYEKETKENYVESTTEIHKEETKSFDDIKEDNAENKEELKKDSTSVDIKGDESKGEKDKDSAMDLEKAEHSNGTETKKDDDLEENSAQVDDIDEKEAMSAKEKVLVKDSAPVEKVEHLLKDETVEKETRSDLEDNSGQVESKSETNKDLAKDSESIGNKNVKDAKLEEDENLPKLVEKEHRNATQDNIINEKSANSEKDEELQKGSLPAVDIKKETKSENDSMPVDGIDNNVTESETPESKSKNEQDGVILKEEDLLEDLGGSVDIKENNSKTEISKSLEILSTKNSLKKEDTQSEKVEDSIKDSSPIHEIYEKETKSEKDGELVMDSTPSKEIKEKKN